MRSIFDGTGNVLSGEDVKIDSVDVDASCTTSPQALIGKK